MSDDKSKKRLAFLEQQVASGKADSFARYALALEYKNLGRVNEALGTFDALRQADPAYVPMYLMCGQMLVESGHHQEARVWLEAGLGAARAKGDSHAHSELEAALAALG